MELHAPPAGFDLDSSSEQLARAWLVATVERTPLDRVADVDLELFSTEAIPLIAGVLRALELAPRSGANLPEDLTRRARGLGRLRRGERASAEIQLDLAALHSLLIASLDRAAPLRPSDRDVAALRRLAEIFGSLHAALAGHTTDEPHPERASPTTLSGDGDLDGSLDALLAEYRRYGHPFALALIEVEGLREIYESHGRESGELMSSAATTMIRNQIRIVDRAFQVNDDAFCVLAPNVDAGRLRRMGNRLARVVEGSQADQGARISISAGVSACPEHGHDRERLLDVAREALDSARETGEAVGIAALNGSRRKS